jgi:hypothetical protein
MFDPNSVDCQNCEGRLDCARSYWALGEFVEVSGPEYTKIMIAKPDSYLSTIKSCSTSTELVQFYDVYLTSNHLGPAVMTVYRATATPIGGEVHVIVGPAYHLKVLHQLRDDTFSAQNKDYWSLLAKMLESTQTGLPSNGGPLDLLPLPNQGEQ